MQYLQRNYLLEVACNKKIKVLLCDEPEQDDTDPFREEGATTLWEPEKVR